MYLIYLAFLASCKAFLQSATVSYSTSSQESFDIATKWIQECVRSHRLCAIPDSPVLPTRVIDLGPYDDPVSRRYFNAAVPGRYDSV
jgi:hypothetical protein